MKNKHRPFAFAIAAAALLLLVGLGLWSIQIGPRLWSRQGGWDQKPLQGLADFGLVPEFSLTERTGKPVRLQDLAGKVWVTNFIYTACTDTCPIQSAAMARLQSDLDLKGKIKLVSITVDPKRDTPEVLSQYASRFGAHPDQWFFLTGKQEEIYRLAQEGFRLSTVPVPDSLDNPAFIHSSRLVLVDGEAKIRGYYESNDPQALHKLTRDIKLILEQNKTYG